MNLFDEIFATIYLENVFYIITLTVRLDGRTVVGRACLRIFNYVGNGISLSLCEKIFDKNYFFIYFANKDYCLQSIDLVRII